MDKVCAGHHRPPPVCHWHSQADGPLAEKELDNPDRVVNWRASQQAIAEKQEVLRQLYLEILARQPWYQRAARWLRNLFRKEIV